MVCRNMLIYGVSRLIEDLAFIRSKLVGDWLGQDHHIPTALGARQVCHFFGA